jgi:hypothetical protein
VGGDPVGVFRENGRPFPTYCNNTVMRIPAAASEAMDKELLRATGRRLPESYLRDPRCRRAADPAVADSQG